MCAIAICCARSIRSGRCCIQPRTPKLLEDIRDAAAFIADATRDVAEVDYQRNSIREWVDRIEAYTRDGRDAFMASTLIQDGMVRNFEVIGEAAKRLTPALTQSRPEVPWRRVAGFRDVLIHQYRGIDLYAVWNVVEHELLDLKRAVAALLAQP